MVERSETQKAILAILPKISSTISMAGSAAILAECFHFDRSRLQLVHHRILCLMAIFDLIESPWNFVSTWAMPAESQEKFTAGNRASCTAQGFFLQTSVAVVILNAFLSWYYLLVIRYSWTEEKIKAIAQPIIFGITLLFGLGTAIAGIPLNLYHPANLWCWIASDVDVDPRENNTNEYLTYRIAFYYGPLLISTVVIIINTAILVWTVRQIEGRSKKYTKRAYEKRASGGGDGGTWGLKKKKNQKKAKDAADDGREKRMAELKRKLAEVKRKSSRESNSSDGANRSKGSGNTDSVMQLRAKKKQHHSVKDAEARAQAESTSDDSRHVQVSLKADADADAFEGNSSNAAAHKMSKQKKKGKVTKSKTSIVAEQSLYYVLAFFLTYIWSGINRLFFMAPRKLPFFFIFCHAFFDPFQGCLNYIVYIRPQFLAHRKKFPSLSIRQCLVALITHTEFKVNDSIAVLENEAKQEIAKWAADSLASKGRGGAIEIEQDNVSSTGEDPTGIARHTHRHLLASVEEEEDQKPHVSQRFSSNELYEFPISQDKGLDKV